MTKPLQWNQVPYDPALSTTTNAFLQWMQQSIIALDASTTAIAAPTLSVKAVTASAIRLDWNSVAGAATYNVYESLISGITSDPVVTVTANGSGGQNSLLHDRPNLGLFSYAVQGVDADGNKGALSDFKSAGSLPENIQAFSAPPLIVFNFFLATDLVMPSPMLALDRQPMLFVFGQTGAGGHSITWASNVRSHGTVSLTAGVVSIQHFVWWPGASPGDDPLNPSTNGTVYPTTTMIFT